MKYSIKTLLLTLTVTLVIGQAKSNAQFKFGGKSGGKSGSSSSRQSSGRSFGGFSSSRKSSGQSSSKTKGTSSFGGFSSRGQSSRPSNTLSKGQIQGSFNSGKTFSKGGITFGGNSNSKLQHNFTNKTKGGFFGNNNNNNSNVHTKDIKRPWINNGSSSSKVNVQLGHWDWADSRRLSRRRGITTGTMLRST